MPELIFTGFIQHHYPAIRDAKGILLGEVDPDDIRDLDAAPDRMWREPTEEDRTRIAAAKAAAAKKAAEEAAGHDEPRDDDTGDGSGDSAGPDDDAGHENDGPPPAVTAGPTPAPPAVIPPA